MCKCVPAAVGNAPLPYVLGTIDHLQSHKPLQCCTVRAGDVVLACLCVPPIHI